MKTIEKLFNYGKKIQRKLIPLALLLSMSCQNPFSFKVEPSKNVFAFFGKDLNTLTEIQKLVDKYNMSFETASRKNIEAMINGSIYDYENLKSQPNFNLLTNTNLYSWKDEILTFSNSNINYHLEESVDKLLDLIRDSPVKIDYFIARNHASNTLMKQVVNIPDYLTVEEIENYPEEDKKILREKISDSFKGILLSCDSAKPRSRGGKTLAKAFAELFGKPIYAFESPMWIFATLYEQSGKGFYEFAYAGDLEIISP